jgi:hypothetical protein
MKKNFFSKIKPQLLFIIFMASSSIASASWDVAKIPQHLKENAVAVIREETEVFEAHSLSRGVYKHRFVITILEKKGDKFADLFIPYDSQIRVRKYSGTIYDASGRRIRNLKKDEFFDQSNNTDLYSDDRKIFTDIYRSQYPFTVEFEYEIEMRNGYFLSRWANWLPQFRPEVSVQRSEFILITHKDLEYNYRMLNSDLQPLTSLGNPFNRKRWEARDLPAIKIEPYMPPLSGLTPVLRVSSKDFHYGGTTGSMATWQDYGKWINELNKGRQNLPADAVKKVHELVEGVEDPAEKVRILYEYMQSRSRYVSIQLGIGGFQPFDAATVHKNGYGDCKALSNYTMALLQAAGIESYYTLIYSSETNRTILEDFPTKAFNHAILMVPVDGDTIWLECTSNHFPMGYIGSSNSDRRVLVVTPEGGKLLRTPRYDHESNKRVRITNARLETNGNVEFSKNTLYHGLRIEDRLGVFLVGSGQQRRYLQQVLGINNPEIVEFSYNKSRAANPVLEENVIVSTNQYVSRAGNRMLVLPNVFSRLTSTPSPVTNRVHPLYIQESALYADTVFWEIPQGFIVSHIPEPVIIENEFGYFQTSYELKDNKLVYERKFYLHKGLHPPDKYAAFIEFFTAIVNADRSQIILTRG